MPKFVSTERVAVTVEGDPNTIYIKPKMDFGTRNRVDGTATRISRQVGEARASAAFDIGAYQIALLTHNIVGWAGPDFDTVECTPENIARLDPDDPLLEAVLQQINDRNVRKTEEGAGGTDGEGEEGEGISPNSRTNGRYDSTKAKAAPVAS